MPGIFENSCLVPRRCCHVSRKHSLVVSVHDRNKAIGGGLGPDHGAWVPRRRTEEMVYEGCLAHRVLPEEEDERLGLDVGCVEHGREEEWEVVVLFQRLHAPRVCLPPRSAALTTRHAHTYDVHVQTLLTLAVCTAGSHALHIFNRYIAICLHTYPHVCLPIYISACLRTCVPANI
jgi:hypothetical protein